MLKILEYIKKIENGIIYNTKYPCNVSMHKGFGDVLIITTYVHLINNKNLHYQKAYSKQELLHIKIETDIILDLYIEEASKELLDKIKN